MPAPINSVRTRVIDTGSGYVAQMSTEIWKDVVGYEGAYSVSNLGRVRRDRACRGARPGMILKGLPLPKGHLRVMLYRDGKVRNHQVHRLVAFAFLGQPPSGKHEVAHGDGNPANNAASNLRWATRVENESDKLLHGTHNRGERCGTAKLSEQAVLEIRAAYAAGGVTQRGLADRFGVSFQSIHSIIKFKNWAWLSRPA